MGVGNSAEAIAGPVNQSWLYEMTPWLPADSPPAITLLPDRIADGKAVYNADTAPLVKQIRSQGLDAQFLPTPDQTFKSEYSAEAVIVLSLLLNIASNAAWDSFKFLLHMIRLRAQRLRQAGEEPQLTLSQGIFRYPNGSSYLWQRFSGSAEQVLDLAESAVREYMSANEGYIQPTLKQESECLQSPAPPEMKRGDIRATSAEIAISLLMFTGQIEGMALHYDTSIPPPKGPRRTLILLNRGIEQLHTAKRLYSKACDQLGCPWHHHHDSPYAPWWIYKPTRPGRDTRCANGQGQHGNAESLAREALNSAVRAFNLLEDLPESEDAHRLIHEIGMFVSRHFGCKIELRDGLWRWSCPVIMAHLRFGQSAGFTAARICSICRENIMSDRCPHMPMHSYKVTVQDPSKCPCRSKNCGHAPGTVIEVEPTSLVEEVDSFEEISWVARPRDPLARIQAVSYTPEQMAVFMGTEIPSDISTIECLHCRQACTGLWDFRTLGKLLGR
jgi:hypothetical protein